MEAVCPRQQPFCIYASEMIWFANMMMVNFAFISRNKKTLRCQDAAGAVPEKFIRSNVVGRLANVYTHVA